MKMFSDCSGECCVCACGGGCLAGHGDDDYSPASKEQVIERLIKGEYKSYTDYMKAYLFDKFAFDYDADKEKIVTADRLLKENGFLLSSCDERYLTYEKHHFFSNGGKFEVQSSDILKFDLLEKVFVVVPHFLPVYKFDALFLKAVYEKVKELGWIE